MLDASNNERKGDWIQTFSGKQFFAIDPRPEEVDIRDIAHALSLMCRYAGHCINFYSVAEHSVLLSYAVSPENQLWALLHDASEAYLVDIPRPIKPYIQGYFDLEAKLMQVITEKFGLSGNIPDEVKEFDYRILIDERDQNMKKSEVDWCVNVDSIGVKLNFWNPLQAEAKFLLRFQELTQGK